MKAAIFVPTNPPDHVIALSAMEEGLSRVGIETGIIQLRDDPVVKTHDMAVVFGVGKRAVLAGKWRGAVLQAYGHKALVIEKGFIKRDKYFSVGWGGLNGRADFSNFRSDNNRWDLLDVQMKPWEDNPDGHYVVCGQVPWDASVQDLNHLEWCHSVVNTLRSSGQKVIFRPHPKTPDKSVYGIEWYSVKPLYQDLIGAKAVVTHNSNAGVDAAISGIPVIAFDKGSMVYSIAGNSLVRSDNPMKPDRTAWANDIAYAQWTVDEMASGETWNHIKKGF
jgi:hypothetical protein